MRAGVKASMLIVIRGPRRLKLTLVLGSGESKSRALVDTMHKNTQIPLRAGVGPYNSP